MKKREMIAAALGLTLVLTTTTCPYASAVSFPDAQQYTEGNFDPFMYGTLQSCTVTEVPWENDPKFLEAKEKYSCPILMAAYKTVLFDPLPGEESNVHTAAEYVSGTVIEPNKIFSQNCTAGPYTIERGYKKGPTYIGKSYTETIGGGVCKIASTLYNVAILSNLEIVERHAHSMPVPYVPYGQDATVCYGAKDIRFRNNTSGNILIWAQGIDNILYIACYGQTVPPKIVWNHDVMEVIQAPIYYQTNSSLPCGTEKVSHAGMDGALIRSWITLTYPDGRSEIKDLSDSSYHPLPYIIEISG